MHRTEAITVKLVNHESVEGRKGDIRCSEWFLDIRKSFHTYDMDDFDSIISIFEIDPNQINSILHKINACQFKKSIYCIRRNSPTHLVNSIIIDHHASFAIPAESAPDRSCR